MNRRSFFATLAGAACAAALQLGAVTRKPAIESFDPISYKGEFAWKNMAHVEVPYTIKFRRIGLDSAADSAQT